MSDEEGRAQERLELDALRRVAQVVSGSLDLEVVLPRVLDIAIEVAHADAGVIYLRDDQRSAYRRAVFRNLDEPLAPPELDWSLVEQQLGDGGALQLDLDHPPPVPLAHTLRAAGIRHVFVAPLRAEGRLVGVLSLNFFRPLVVAPATALTLQAIADQEAVAIATAFAHARLELRARVAVLLQRFGERALAPGPDDDLHRLILDTAAQLVRCDRGLVTHIAEGRSRLMAGFGKDEQLIGFEVGIDEPSVAHSLARDEPFIVEDARTVDPQGLIGQVLQRHETVSFVLLNMRYQGVPIGQIVVASGVPVHYAPEELEGLRLLSSMGAEALERARVHAAAEAERRRLDDVIENLPLVVAVFDSTGHVLHVNAAGRQFGERAGGVGVDWRTAMSRLRTLEPDGREIRPEDWMATKAFQGVRSLSHEIVLTDAEGGWRMSALAFALPMPSADGVVREVVTGFQDVTALRELADAKDRFLRIASHELRSPLTSLIATFSLLDMDPAAIANPERRTTLLSRAQRQLDRMTRLVEQLLDAARLNAPEVPLNLGDVDLLALCREAMELTCESAGHPCVLDAEGVLMGRWDALRLEQVLTNLLANAIRYGTAGRPITVRVRADEHTATVEVIDQGMGIPAAQLDRVFTPFFRGSNVTTISRGGLGLGMYITAEIVRRHGGTIRVASREGEGSTFTVELPRAPGPG